MHAPPPLRTLSSVEDVDDVAAELPARWCTVADIAAQVVNAAAVAVDEVGDAAGVTVVLHNFFAAPPPRKRSRSHAVSPLPRADGATAPGTRTGGLRCGDAAATRCCTAALRRAVLAALATAGASVGCAGAVGHSGCVVVVHAGPSAECAGRPSRRSAPHPGSRWCVDGVCVVEEVGHAYRADSDSCAGVSPPASPGTTCTAACPRPDHTSAVACAGRRHSTGAPLCGVRLVWVSAASRGRGVAHRMVERARRSVTYGCDIAAADVAFAEPTAMGTAFARHYSGRPDFLVYYYR
ncbi:ESCO acetyltransferase domain-containing protein [Novymonas esmeraldas]|uniref:ESCO acetyltransferase domain-containing protein n=1 Tax=Novymonas esmeraldas TaxID=1808958 RepID=A0AAW0F6M6_9TRYP